MSIPADDQVLLSRFAAHLVEAGFGRVLVAHHLERAESFLAYLRQLAVSPESVTPEHVSRYLRAQLQRYRRKHSRSSPNSVTWHNRQSGGVHRFLAFIQGCWPPKHTPTNEHERSINAVLVEYKETLERRRGLSKLTIAGRIYEARRFLQHFPGTDLRASLVAVSIQAMDSYIKDRARGLARSTCASVCIHLRGVLRFLHDTARIPRDLAPAIIGPSRYRHEGLPSTISADQIRLLLQGARKDRSPRGVRNYAILLLLTTYGLRASEICKLRVDDIDWRASRLWIRHFKTGARTCLPLLPGVGHALLNYLRRGRPACKDREVFVRMHAPRTALVTNTAINSLLRRHMARVGVRLSGKRGPHVFRHARAASLLKVGVPLKTIGDILGHRSACSTAVYLKLDDERLREVSLSLPLPEVMS
jgi:site-specific recombinase XerD